MPGLTVVTNSLLVAQALAHANRVEVVMTGGTLRGSNYALVGSGAEQSLHGLRVSRAFLSGSGLTAERGLSTSNMLSASVDRALVQAAAEVVVLGDHTKLGTDTMFQTVPTDLITRLVTDEPPAHDDRAATELQALADQGVQITVAGAQGGSAGAGGPGSDPGSARQQRRDVPLPGPRRQVPGAGGGLRSASMLGEQGPGRSGRGWRICGGGSGCRGWVPLLCAVSGTRRRCWGRVSPQPGGAGPLRPCASAVPGGGAGAGAAALSEGGCPRRRSGPLRPPVLP